MRTIITVFLALAMFLSPARANWMYYEDSQGPFAEDPVRMMITGEEKGGLAFVCTRERGVEILFMLPERADPQTLAAINRLKPQLLLWLDDKMYSFPAEATETNGNKAFSARASRKIIEEAGMVKRHIIAAVKLLEGAVLKHSFPAAGSSAASRILLEKCEAK